MTPEELAASQAIEKKLNEISEANQLKADKAALETLTKDLKVLTDKYETERAEATKKTDSEITELKKTIATQGEVITKFSDFGGAKEATPKNIGEAISKALTEEHAGILKGISEGKKNFGFEIKSAATMTRGNYSGGVVGMSELEPGLTMVQMRKPYLRTLINVGSIGTWYATWIEQANQDPGAAGMVAEGAAKTLQDFDMVERKMPVEKVTAYIRVSQEALEDIDFLQSEINNELVRLVELKLDAGIFNGDGNTPNLKGITTYATAYSVPSGFANEIPYANRFDVIQACVTQSQVLNFDPDTVLLNALDYGLMNITKAPATGDYARPFVFNTATGMNVAGCDVYVNNGVTADKVVVMERKKSNLRIRKDISLTIKPSADATDEKNLWVIVAEMRAVHYIKTNHIGAFIYADVSEAMSGLLDSTPLT